MMIFKALLLLLLLQAFNTGEGRSCGTHELSASEKERSETRLQEYLQENGDTLPRQQTVIDTYWHVIHSNGNGRLTQAEVDASIAVLNQDFADSGSSFQFNLVDTTFTNNPTWFKTDRNSDFFDMSQALRVGDCSTANIFSTGMSDSLGFVYYFPEETRNSCRGSYIDDGIWIRHTTVPGGSDTDYGLGKTLVHEMGHWMGLYHTFSGCNAPGDYIADTPPEGRPNYGCPSSRNTCSGGQNDPIENYMDYSDDACMTEFTPLQVNRMLAQFYAFRAIGIGNVAGISGDFCFSPHATAMVKDKGKVSMKDLNVGDYVLTASGQYQMVFTINHFHPTQSTNFLQIHTELTGIENALEVSAMHLVYIERKKDPVPVIDVQVGDYLQTLDYGPRKVTDIKIVRRSGFYNPITTDGTMLVDGIIASSYTSFTGSAYLEVAGVKLISAHNLLDMTTAPYRTFCMTTSLSMLLCNQHGEDKLPFVVQLVSDFYKFWSKQSAPVQFGIIGFYVAIFSLMNLVLSVYSIYFLAALTGWFFIFNVNKKQARSYFTMLFQTKNREPSQTKIVNCEQSQMKVINSAEKQVQFSKK